jgi:catechol 2,3-dioxygenase-like lactoylglutathione lyase family enzyme
VPSALVPELEVSDLAASLAFYLGVCGFAVAYERPEERFVYLEREGAELMLEEAGGAGFGNRQFVVADPDGYLLRFFQDLGERPA